MQHHRQQLCSPGSSGDKHRVINGPLPEEEEDEKHTPTADRSTGRKPTLELQHQGDADLLETGAEPTSTWDASPDANHYATIA